MPAVSKKQQRFFGMVRAAQKGEMDNPSKEVLDVANDISMKDAKKFAKTKHKGLPEKKKVDECWKTHKKVGMKMKGGKLVPDCRPKNKKVTEETIDENYGTGRARRARMGGVQPKTVGAVSNSELDAEFKKKKEKDKAKDRETASKVDVSGLSPADALMKRKAAERKAERIRIKASKMRKEEVEVTGGFQFQDYDPNMKFREYEFIDIIKAESLKGAVSESSDYEKLKKKVGSKVKHDKPAMTFKEFKNINKYT